MCQPTTIKQVLNEMRIVDVEKKIECVEGDLFSPHQSEISITQLRLWFW